VKGTITDARASTKANTVHSGMKVDVGVPMTVGPVSINWKTYWMVYYDEHAIKKP
jgi:hypothetical protein